MIASIVLVIGLGSVGAGPSTDEAPERYALKATLAPAPAASGDGRFELQATARLAGSDAQRFAVKGTAASCSTADGVFSDSFETP